MRPLIPGYAYELTQLGGGTQVLRFEGIGPGFRFEDVLRITHDRSLYLDNVLACLETRSAICFIDMALGTLRRKRSLHHAVPAFSVRDPGHVYVSGTQELRFVKRSGGAIQYPKEWPGAQTQEVFRAIIYQAGCLLADTYDPLLESVIEDVREALYQYELRAWRRKREKANRTEREHDDAGRHKPWRSEPDGAPFDSYEIELRPVGPDGHILLNEEHA